MHLERRLIQNTPSQANFSITAPIIPTRPPPLLPARAIKHLLAQLTIHLIMRLAQPRPKVAATAHPRRIAVRRQPGAEVGRTRPARIQPRERMHKRRRIALLSDRRSLGVCCCHAVQQRPGGPAERIDVGWAVGGRRAG